MKVNTITEYLGCVAAALLLCSCSRQHVAAARTTSVAQTMQRQVSNATDVGDGDYQTRNLREQLIADPNNLTVRLALADRYWKAGVQELALEHYRFAVERFPDNPKIAILLARALRDDNRPADAIDALVKFCNRNTNPSPDLLSLLGILQDDAGKFAAAEAVYKKAINEAPARADLRNNLGYNLLLQGRPKEAAEQLQEALKLDPHSQVANDNLGLALLAQWKDDTQPKEALLRWQSVSDPASAHNNLAAVLMDQRRYAQARTELGIALGYQKDHAAALENLRLVSELDGGTATPPRLGRNSFWRRVKTAFKSHQPPQTAQTAANHQ